MRKIVVGTRGGPDREAALDFALEEAVRRRLPLLVVHAYQSNFYGEVPLALFPDTLSDLHESALHGATSALERAQDRVPGGRTVDVRLVVLEGDPATELLSRADSAALLVVGSHGANAFARGVLRSVSVACLHRSWAPVAVVPHHSPATLDRAHASRVVVALDGSLASLTALSWATAQAREWGCSLAPVVVSTSDDEVPTCLRHSVRDARNARNDLAHIIRDQVADAGGAQLEVHPRLLTGDPAEQLLGVLGPRDLLVTGSRGHNAFAGLLLGSTSTSVSAKAPCPVVVVRAGQARREIHQRRSSAASPGRPSLVHP